MASLTMELSSLPSAFLPAPYFPWAWLALLLASIATLLPRYGRSLSLALEKQALISRAVLSRSRSSIIAAPNPLRRLNLVRSRSVDSALNLQQGSIASGQQQLPLDALVSPIKFGSGGLQVKAHFTGDLQDSIAFVPIEEASMNSTHGSSHAFKFENCCVIKQREKALQSSSSSLPPPCPAVAPIVHHAAIAPKLKEPFRWDICLAARLEGLTPYSTPCSHRSKIKAIDVVDGNCVHTHFASEAVKLWYPQQDQSLHALNLHSITHKVPSVSVESWDHGLLCVGHRKGGISLWDIETETCLGSSSSSKYRNMSVSALSLNDGLGFITGVAEHAHFTYSHSVMVVDHRSTSWIVKHPILLGFTGFAIAGVEAKANEVRVLGADSMSKYYDLRAMRGAPIAGSNEVNHFPSFLT